MRERLIRRVENTTIMQPLTFEEYLDRRFSKKDTVSMYLRDLRAAERRIGSKIDEYLAEDRARRLPVHCKAADRTAVNRYREFLRNHSENEEDSGVIDERALAETDRFSLEADLQRSLRNNLTQLAPDLTVADDGSERSIATGRIDVLARDSTGVWWVIELKAGTANDRAVSQLAAYMGALAEEESGEIRGLLVAHDFTEKARYAASVVPGVKLMRYGFSFTFEKHA